MTSQKKLLLSANQPISNQVSNFPQPLLAKHGQSILEQLRVHRKKLSRKAINQRLS